jgi:hypothetical protein
MSVSFSSATPLEQELSLEQLVFRSPGWSTKSQTTNPSSGNPRSMMITSEDSDEEEDMTESILGSMMFVPRDRNDDSVSDFGDSISRMGASFKNLMESAVTNIKESVKEEIVRIPTARESFIETEKTRSLRLILDDQNEFRKFKAEMKASGRVCSSRNLLDEKIANKVKMNKFSADSA